MYKYFYEDIYSVFFHVTNSLQERKSEANHNRRNIIKIKNHKIKGRRMRKAITVESYGLIFRALSKKVMASPAFTSLAKHFCL